MALPQSYKHTKSSDFSLPIPSALTNNDSEAKGQPAWLLLLEIPCSWRCRATNMGTYASKGGALPPSHVPFLAYG